MVKDRTARVALLASALLAFGGTTALAQDDGAPDDGAPAPEAAPTAEGQAVGVVGTSTLVGQESPGTTEMEDRVIRVRDNILVTVEESSDPRVSGRATITVNFDAYADQSGMPGTSQVRFGQMQLENDDGTWTGHFTGSLANGGFVQTYWLEGAGDYEGLSYVVTAGGNGNTWRTSGLIFPGEIPPMQGAITLPTDSLGPDLPTATAPAG